ncbi:MAG: rhodanese-like domain-containing protein [Idiomarina sp.]
MEQLIEFAGDHYLMSLLWVGLLLALVVTLVQSKLSNVKTYTPQQATLLVNRQDGAFLDIRSVEEYKKAHIQGAIHLTAERVKNNDTASLEKFKDAPIVVVCATGLTSKAVATQLQKAGFSQAAVMQGGISAWQSASFPMTKK